MRGEKNRKGNESKEKRIKKKKKSVAWQKKKIDKLDLKFNFCALCDVISKMKRQPTQKEEILVNYISAKELVCRIYKKLM